MEGLLFGLKLGTLIPLIPPFYCQLFPSYRRICTEFRICATVHHSNLYPTDAALSFISSINTNPPHPTTIPSSRCPQQYSFLFLFPPYLRHLAALGSDGAVARRQVKLESICAQRTIGAWRFTAKKKKKLILILSIHTGRHGCAPLSLVVPKKKTALKHWPGLLRKLHLPIMKQSARVCADASVGGGHCVRVLAYTHAFFAAVHVCASANMH